ncbi:hypothetical protein NDU88_005037 [Pleurodeles waltl]|uniref:Uncharacterized protein n=1 Tax=Pleurodeles waltl TaxID=8319 RepID=A0AAV7TUH3_PLEWA|nr:hypothetical protein NDU88_005037 [Pleurodeles waltl]
MDVPASTPCQPDSALDQGPGVDADNMERPGRSVASGTAASGHFLLHVILRQQRAPMAMHARLARYIA